MALDHLPADPPPGGPHDEDVNRDIVVCQPFSAAGCCRFHRPRPAPRKTRGAAPKCELCHCVVRGSLEHVQVPYCHHGWKNHAPLVCWTEARFALCGLCWNFLRPSIFRATPGNYNCTESVVFNGDVYDCPLCQALPPFRPVSGSSVEEVVADLVQLSLFDPGNHQIIFPHADHSSFRRRART